jgi:hypothetical protein
MVAYTMPCITYGSMELHRGILGTATGVDLRDAMYCLWN